ncbi:hypothetical protein D3H55_15620 [Bacillus salacetis]|uniref:LysM domain-containing protein n=1 Tax=Bacillus salacetis TaxID=2315464 RepID=A0A3A1QYB2_9BACI|nr:hypothetical protein [Bacillus salacetis]RIW31038.1 hypothetical protein D3H55_15620 [Bacillus salacetis]
MKRLYVFLLFMIITYSIYYDLKAGTLPRSEEAAVTVNVNEQQPLEITPEETNESKIDFVTVEIKSGDTILSIMEEALDGPLPVSIDQLIEDFKFLNEGQSPHEIQVGKDYKLPVY